MTSVATQAEPRFLVSEIYLSVQGESTYVGLPCVFVRLTGCPLRCRWCDTEYAFTGGERMTLSSVMDKIRSFNCELVEVTGGEPLAQPNCPTLLAELVDQGYTVLLETSGSYSIAPVPKAVRKIVDLKCPGSGEMARNLYANMEHLEPHDEVKFVIADRADFDWALSAVRQYGLTDRCPVLFSPVFGEVDPKHLVEWILESGDRRIRFQLQAHKVIWPPATRGV